MHSVSKISVSSWSPTAMADGSCAMPWWRSSSTTTADATGILSAIFFRNDCGVDSDKGCWLLGVKQLRCLEWAANLWVWNRGNNINPLGNMYKSCWFGVKNSLDTGWYLKIENLFMGNHENSENDAWLEGIIEEVMIISYLALVSDGKSCSIHWLLVSLAAGNTSIHRIQICWFKA